MIKAIPEFISFGEPDQLAKSAELKKTFEVLLIRARGDNTDSIRV